MHTTFLDLQLKCANSRKEVDEYDELMVVTPIFAVFQRIPSCGWGRGRNKWWGFGVLTQFLPGLKERKKKRKNINLVQTVILPLLHIKS